MKRLSGVLLSASLLLCLLCGCQKSENLSETSAAPPPLQDSVTYVAFDDADEYYPVSYVQDGVQQLVGDMGPASLLPEDFLPEQSSAALSQIETGSQGGRILSNGPWDFFPDLPQSQTYSLLDQPEAPQWHRYFQEKLTSLGCDSPVVFQNAATFLWDGRKAAVVTAENCTIAEPDSLLTPEEAQTLSAAPANAAPAAYRFVTLFVQGQPPVDLYREFCKIPSPDEGPQAGFSYSPWPGETHFLHYLTTWQMDESGAITEFPLLANATGQPLLRSLTAQFRWLVADIDGCGTSELLFRLHTPSSLSSGYWVYEIKNGNISQRLHIGMG